MKCALERIERPIEMDMFVGAAHPRGVKLREDPPLFDVGTPLRLEARRDRRDHLAIDDLKRAQMDIDRQLETVAFGVFLFGGLRCGLLDRHADDARMLDAQQADIGNALEKPPRCPVKLDPAGGQPLPFAVANANILRDDLPRPVAVERAIGDGAAFGRKRGNDAGGKRIAPGVAEHKRRRAGNNGNKRDAEPNNEPRQRAARPDQVSDTCEGFQDRHQKACPMLT